MWSWTRAVTSASSSVVTSSLTSSAASSSVVMTSTGGSIQCRPSVARPSVASAPGIFRHLLLLLWVDGRLSARSLRLRDGAAARALRGGGVAAAGASPSLCSPARLWRAM
eukprot:CAMPEP_0197608340 /NCGR_PEP_ID=MMETSP1326-20131121/48880_1 /TAXON_ID=1155430 /ORGANISM="Genus nov. species nov., Strain RCC2288" /LENGTH=109 /DNA_ID=CAMNT_0043176527 /DNA_START=52 /DNA_END=381 /DNA_ORIENTATION=+